MGQADDGRVRVVVVDDHHSLRHLVLLNLEIDGGFEVVGEGADGDDAIRLTTETRPDVLVLDIGLPGRDGFEVLEVLRDAVPATRIVVFTGWSGERDQERVLAAGAARCVVKSELSAIVDAIREEGRAARDRAADG